MGKKVNVTKGAKAAKAETAAYSEEAEREAESQIPNGPKTWCVGGWSTIRTVADALKVVFPGDRIILLPGIYDENVIIDLEKGGFEIAGASSNPEDCVITGGLSTAVDIKISNVTICGGVNFDKGTTKMETCILKGGRNGITIYAAADPMISKCKICEFEITGVYSMRSRGTLQDCEIVGPKKKEDDSASSPTKVPVPEGNVTGIFLDDTAAMIRRNRITQCVTGVIAGSGGSPGRFISNEISGNVGTGIQCLEGCLLTLKKNTLMDNALHFGSALVVENDSAPVLEQNVIHGSATIHMRSKPRLKANQILGTIRDHRVSSETQKLADITGVADPTPLRVNY
eukprot:NODE_2467_length_1109_cov_33.625472_g2048_i0.p1 GENE.NODE_2467_length_1109_cov_33.625472_g2048_i0~~NODE_2467_length_1109_cov_33.625472_g2048_i0.p1  ORF type:complete len:342 (+),score=65.41 NODE_2467_length_1109_cov_33.625472_g2048_i0:3-1028(+)